MPARSRPRLRSEGRKCHQRLLNADFTAVDSRAEGLAAKLMRVHSMFSMAACRIKRRPVPVRSKLCRARWRRETYHLGPLLHRRVDSHFRAPSPCLGLIADLSLGLLNHLGDG